MVLQQRLHGQHTAFWSSAPDDARLLCARLNRAEGRLHADELEKGSPLEMCYFLGKLQEQHYMLSKPKGVKGKDATIKLPLIACVPPCTPSASMPAHVALPNHSRMPVPKKSANMHWYDVWMR